MRFYMLGCTLILLPKAHSHLLACCAGNCVEVAGIISKEPARIDLERAFCILQSKHKLEWSSSPVGRSVYTVREFFRDEASLAPHAELRD